jgi:hypothetical protein
MLTVDWRLRNIPMDSLAYCLVAAVLVALAKSRAVIVDGVQNGLSYASGQSQQGRSGSLDQRW